MIVRGNISAHPSRLSLSMVKHYPKHLDALRKVNSDLAAIHKEDQEREAKTIDADYKDVSDE